MIDVFVRAIATMEGFYKSGTLAQKNNNPGNLRSWAGTETSGGYARFKRPEDGWRALRIQTERNLFIRRLTILEFFQGKRGVYPGYAPKADNNNPEGYAEFVRSFLLKELPELTILLPPKPVPQNTGVNALLADFPYTEKA